MLTLYVGNNLLLAGQTLSEETINEPSMRHFWETVTTSVTARELGGHVDIFVPLVETGKDLTGGGGGHEVNVPLETMPMESLQCTLRPVYTGDF